LTTRKPPSCASSSSPSWATTCAIPLASIDAAGRLLKRTPLNERAVLLVEGMHKSVMRMAGLIDNVLDFARGRLGGGLGIDRQACTALPIRLAEVIQELQLANPGRRIETEIVLADDVTCDPDRPGRRCCPIFWATP
jgi:sigma-B regulation protein RsbU (phosphoserine phosphatase)